MYNLTHYKTKIINTVTLSSLSPEASKAYLVCISHWPCAISLVSDLGHCNMWKTREADTSQMF